MRKILLTLLLFSFTSAAQEVIYELPPNETISFYTRVAPDESAIGFTKTRRGLFRYDPIVLSLSNNFVSPLDAISYDPTFSPDYSLRDNVGFLFGARGGSTAYAKYFSFYLPGKFENEKFEIYFSNISGYASVALLKDETILPDTLKPYLNKYIIMGKRWRWFILDAVTNSGGEIIDFKRVYPESGTLAAAPLCTNLGGNFDFADSLLSPKAQYISLKRTDHNKVPVIVRTKDCSILNTPALSGLYGGKAMFSHNERFMVFHAFGENGKQFMRDRITNGDLIKRRANEGVVANLFLYEIKTDRLIRLTNSTSSSPTVNFFPNFSGDDRWIYYHRHRQGASATEVMKIANPLIGN